MTAFRSVLVAAAFAASWLAAGAAEVRVFAAASLANALGDIVPLFAKTSGDRVRLNLGGSGTLARQIREGAPADVFFSADEQRMDELASAGALLPGSRRTVLSNALVLVVAATDGAPVTTLADLVKPGVHRIAVGDPAIVPAGTYTEQLLKKLQLWDPLRARLVPLENVRAVLAAVEAGNADAGFVYQTDARISPKVRIAVALAPGEGPPITYPVAVVKDSKDPLAAKRFVACLLSPEAQAIFAKYGFLPVR